MLSIATVKVETRNGYALVKVSLENRGASVVGPGMMVGRQTLTGGAVRPVEFRNSTSIPPGSTAKVTQLLSAMRELEFTGYRQGDGVIIPFSGGMVKRASFLRSVAAVTARWWDEILSQSTSVVARLRARYATARTPLAVDKTVNHGGEVAARDWRSIYAEFGRWRREVFVPRVRSLGARFKGFHANAWLRLAEAKQRMHHRAEVDGQTWESVDVTMKRWWDEVLLPRTRLIVARFRAQDENAAVLVAEAKQERQHRDQMERQAWESVDARIKGWWDKVLLPRTRLIAARFKAQDQSPPPPIAEAKQKKQHRRTKQRNARHSKAR